ncbi:MAG: Asp-tRNA(Asn)/Glu-tRNA(Gln) amidotransferase subunit GatC [Myxococcota bacterium]
MEINAEEVARLAELARLELSPEEVERMRRDLDAILGYVRKLEALDTSQVPATAHVLDVHTPLRSDDVERRLPVEEAVRNAPDHDSSSMIVPRVIE